MKKTRVGFIETVTIKGPKAERVFLARIDTGAARNSIDKDIARKLGIKSIIKHTIVKSAHGTKSRPVVKARLSIAGRKIRASFTIAERTHMRYPLLIGRKTLKKGFIIDPEKKT